MPVDYSIIKEQLTLNPARSVPFFSKEELKGEFPFFYIINKTINVYLARPVPLFFQRGNQKGDFLLAGFPFFYIINKSLNVNLARPVPLFFKGGTQRGISF
jgi:hypothetical protein